MNFGYFPGCSLLGSAREFDESLRAVARALDIHLQEIPDWNCCGATSAHNLSRTLALALPARILALAEKAGMNEVLVPCSACYSRLITARHELLEDQTLRSQLNELIDMEFKGTARVLNILEALTQIFAEPASIKIIKPFARKVACYYGCLLVRPPKVVNFDRPEDPRSMDELMKKIGAEPVDWPHKVECCGAGMSISRTDLVCKLSGKIIDSAEKHAAEAIIVACPMCHANLDMRRADIEKYMHRSFSIPVLYITQAIGLALGIGEKELGLQRHLVPVVFAEKTGPQAETTQAQAEPAAEKAED
jgi:heterodisulfide reductase subunit B